MSFLQKLVRNAFFTFLYTQTTKVGKTAVCPFTFLWTKLRGLLSN